MKCLKLTTVLLLLFAVNALAQKEVGKIFTQKEAAALFGAVTYEKEISISDLQKNLNSTKFYIMFGFESDQLLVLDDNRYSLSPVKKNLSPSKVLHRFSKSKVIEFLKTSPEAKSIKVQMRGDVLSLDNGDKVLEMAGLCPPYC